MSNFWNTEASDDDKSYKKEMEAFKENMFNELSTRDNVIKELIQKQKELETEVKSQEGKFVDKESDSREKILSRVRKACKKVGADASEVIGNTDFLDYTPMEYGATNGQIIAKAALSGDDDAIEKIIKTKLSVKQNGFTNLAEEPVKSSSTEIKEKEENLQDYLKSYINEYY